MRPIQSRFWLYLLLEIKKYRLAFPKILTGLLLILSLSAGCVLLYRLYSTEHSAQQKIRIGISADPEEPYLDWMIQTLSQMKDLKISCQFEFVAEQEGIQKLQAGYYTALFFIPHNYINSLIEGEEAVLRIRFRQGQTTVADYLVRELGNAASQIILDTQAGIYAMQDYYRENDLPDLTADELSLNVLYLQKVLARKNIYTYEEIPADGSTANPAHYLAVGIICLLTAMEFTCIAVLHRESPLLAEKLYLSGLGEGKRFLAREAALCICFGSIYLFLCLLSAMISPKIPGIHSALHLTESSSLHTALCTGWKLAALLPILAVIGTYILWIYELAADQLSSIILLFVSFICFSYLSGYYFPLSTLPDSIRHLAPCLPTGIILHYSRNILSGTFQWRDLMILLGYWIVLSLALILFTQIKRRRSH